jgi:hypothetical protein
MSDDRLIYMTGNGRIAASFLNGNYYEIYGPPYSSPSLFSSRFGEGAAAGSPRRLGRAPVWQVPLTDAFGGNGSVTDFAAAELPVLVRRFSWTGDRPLEMTLCGAAGQLEFMLPYVHPAGLSGDTERFADAGSPVLIKSKRGNYVYNDYPLPFPQFFVVRASGDVSVERCGEFDLRFRVTGEACITLTGGPDYPDVCANYQKLLESTAAGGEKLTDKLLADVYSHWEHVFDRVTCLKELPAELPCRADLIEAIEAAVIGILVQQGAEGGVLAGHPFHLGYVRDQYGVAEGLISLGLVPEARKVLGFYADIFRKCGKILNAQGIGVPGLFHFAENDASEITGYLLLQFFRYLDVSGDTAFLEDNTDFLRWLFERQAGTMRAGELPFNGDETYIACGLLGRDAVSDGSAEATLLFIRSGLRLADFLVEHGVPQTETDRIRTLVEEAERGFSAHFIRDGRYCVNDPDTSDLFMEPWRYGVCMACGYFGWTQLTRERSYLCPHCLAAGKVRVKIDCPVSLPSSLLMPAYLGADLPEIRDSVVNEITRMLAEFDRTGHAYSVPEGRINVGYDYGLLLCNMLHYGISGAERIYRRILAMRDGVGMYSETYIEGKPTGTRFRPWETAINVDALLKFARSWRG